MRRRYRIAILSLLLALLLVIWSVYFTPDPIQIDVVDRRDMVLVPGGSFRAFDRSYDIEAFYIGRFEVTEAEWASYAAEVDLAAPPFGPEEPRGRDFPVRYVSHDAARAYAEWHLMRLPTNLEWERASQGEGGRAFPWGSGYLPAANTYETWDRRGFVGRGVTRVGTFDLGRSAVGAYDMIGNVWEWTSSTYHDLLRLRLKRDDRELKEHAFASGEADRVVRGGSFAARIWGREELERLLPPETMSWDVGFRCAVSASEVERQEMIIPLVRDLVYRDPINWVRRVWPAQRRLRELAEEASPYLHLAARRDTRPWVLDRIGALLPSPSAP